MQNLAYQLETARDDVSANHCPACGQELFGPDAEACAWQAWGSFWEILGNSNVDLVCGDCGEHLQEFFSNVRK